MDKHKNKLQAIEGRVKEVSGHTADDPTLETRSRAEAIGADLRQAAERLKGVLSK